MVNGQKCRKQVGHDDAQGKADEAQDRDEEPAIAGCRFRTHDLISEPALLIKATIIPSGRSRAQQMIFQCWVLASLTGFLAFVAGVLLVAVRLRLRERRRRGVG